MDQVRLVNAGVNYNEGVQRFGNQPALYEKYLARMFESDSMAQLKKLLEEKDYTGAFRLTHDLKGTSGNLSMNTFYHAICALTEELRNGHPGDQVMTLYEDAAVLYHQVESCVKGGKA